MKASLIVCVLFFSLGVSGKLNDFRALSRELEASGKPGSDKWLQVMGKHLGLSAKDLELDLGPADAKIINDSTFRDALRDFDATAQPSIKMLNDMSQKVDKELSSFGSKPTTKKSIITRKLADDKAEDVPTEEDEAPREEKRDDNPSVKDIITRLKDRVQMINEKVDHIMFHNHHDLGGVTAHYTPSGVQLLPNYKADSLDTKLKAIDYLTYNAHRNSPAAQAILPYYLHDIHDAKGKKQ